MPHPDGSIWFTDPPYGDRLSEGHPDEAGGPTNPQGLLKPGVGAPDAGAIGGKKRELPTAVYRWDPNGKLEVVAEAQLPDPNGLCFSPDYKTLYVISTGAGPGDTGPGGKRVIYAFDVQGQSRQHAAVHRHDGRRRQMRARRHARRCRRQSVVQLERATRLCRGRRVGRAGKLLGRIRLPEVCANLAFGGPKRDRVFMTASQSLYVLQVGIQGAAPG